MRRLFKLLRTLVALACLGGAVFAFLVITKNPLVKPVLYPVRHIDMIEQAAARHKVNPYLLCAIIRNESNWDESAVSRVGAVGLMQVMPQTAQELAARGLVNAQDFPVDKLSDPATNIEYGTAYLAFLKRELHDDELVVAAYNAGIGRVMSWVADGKKLRDAISYPETRAYLDSVLQSLKDYSEAYPEGIH